MKFTGMVYGGTKRKPIVFGRSPIQDGRLAAIFVAEF